MDKKSLSERDICTKFIAPALRKAGWDEQLQIREEVSFTKGRIIVRGKLVTRGQAKRADYVLYYKPNIPIALIEAKDNTHAIGAGIQQALDYAETLNIPFVFSSNGDGFLFHDRTGASTERETTLSLDAFPSPGELWARYRAWKGLTPEVESLVLQDYFDDGGGKVPRYYQVSAINATMGGHRQGRRPYPAGHGDRHWQDLYRIPNHLAAVEGRPQEAHPIPGRSQCLDRPDHGQRLPAVRRRDDEALDAGRDHRPRGRVCPGRCPAASGARGASTPPMRSISVVYQAITGPEERQKMFREFSPGFFDLIVIDECHRGSAAEDSAWREILEYFSAATQIGLTATPKETKYVSNIHYFGEPVYSYSLKQGISDGFLAPLQGHQGSYRSRCGRLPS